MEPHHCFNLTIIEEDEATDIAALQLQHAIVAKLPENARFEINAETIQEAIEQQYQITINLQQISPLGPHYLVKTPSLSAYITILADGHLEITSLNFVVGLIVTPWTKEFGSDIMTMQNPVCSNIIRNYEPDSSSRNFELQISGIPAHFCNDNTVGRLTSDFFDINHIAFTHYTAYVEGNPRHQTCLPSVANLGIKRWTPRGTLLNVWPIWYKYIELLPPTDDEPPYE